MYNGYNNYYCIHVYIYIYIYIYNTHIVVTCELFTIKCHYYMYISLCLHVCMFICIVIIGCIILLNEAQQGHYKLVMRGPPNRGPLRIPMIIQQDTTAKQQANSTLVSTEPSAKKRRAMRQRPSPGKSPSPRPWRGPKGLWAKGLYDKSGCDTFQYNMLLPLFGNIRGLCLELSALCQTSLSSPPRPRANLYTTNIHNNYITTLIYITLILYTYLILNYCKLVYSQLLKQVV